MQSLESARNWVQTGVKGYNEYVFVSRDVIFDDDFMLKHV